LRGHWSEKVNAAEPRTLFTDLVVIELKDPNDPEKELEIDEKHS
jgi:hypothetical protein